jgi:hypothetical protein
MSRGNDAYWRLSVSALVWLALFVVPPTAAAASPTARLSETPGPTLDADEFQHLHESLSGLTLQDIADAVARGRASAEQCTIGRREATCSLFRLTVARGSLAAERLVLTDERLAMEGIAYVAEGSDRTYRAHRLRATSEKLAFEQLELVPGAGDERLKADSVDVGADSVELSAVRWQTRSSSGREWSTRMRASRAIWNPGGWRFERLRRARPFALGLGTVEATRPGPTTGLLPPRVAASDRTVELTQRLVHGPSLTGLSASAAPHQWYGVGGLLQTPPGRNPFDDHRPEPGLLDAQLRWDVGDTGPGWSVVGDVRRGAEHVHLGAHLEEQSADGYWRTRRIDESGMLRGWRESHAGASLSGPRHHLQIRFGHATLVPLDNPDQSVGAFDPDELSAGLDFGVAARPVQNLRLSTRLYHQNRVRGMADNLHRTSVAADATWVAGTRGTAFVQGGLAGLTSMELDGNQGPDSSATGFDIGRSGQLVAHAAAGFTFSGRLGGARHRIAPRLLGLREVTGVGEPTPARLPRITPPSRVPGWTALGAVLDQSLQLGGSRVAFPAGLWMQGARGDPLGDGPYAFGRLRFDWADWTFSGDLRHRVGTRRFDGGAAVDYLGVSLDVGWQMTTDVSGTAPLARVDRYGLEPLDALQLIQPVAGRDRPRTDLFQMLTIGGRTDSVRSDLAIFAEGIAARPGVSVEFIHPFTPYGWGLSLRGAYRTEGNRWGVSAGLATTGPAG